MSPWRTDQYDSPTIASMATSGELWEPRETERRRVIFERTARTTANLISGRLVERYWLKTIALAAAILSCSGACGGPGAAIERTVRAQGVLTHRGSPLQYYQVLFHPKDGRRPA